LHLVSFGDDLEKSLANLSAHLLAQTLPPAASTGGA